MNSKPIKKQPAQPLDDHDKAVLHARAHNALATALAVLRSESSAKAARLAITHVRRALPALGQIGGAS